MLYYGKYDSPAGMLLLTCEDDALVRLEFQVDDRPFLSSETVPEAMEQTQRWLERYFRGEQPKPEDLPLKAEGTHFQKLVWKLLLEIPYGQTQTYGDIAKKTARILGKERMSSQAVGQAVGRNPIAVIIPCHRVLGAGGKLTGYAYGLEYKVWLLDHERNRKTEEI